jgi:anthranilate synthase/aminodeoxychorismate synthase-like glutamine amidotransferase
MILVIDNYDSFTYNLVQYLGELGAEPMVRRNDEVTVDQMRELAPQAIVISPGPGTPDSAGVSIEAVRMLGEKVPILGVCLGHQAIAEAYGGKVVRARKLMHGKTSIVVHDSKDLFQDVPSPLEVMRYHSLTVERESLPRDLEVTAWDSENKSEIHAIRHRVNPVWGVQFHPESIMTQSGKKILSNFLEIAK